MIGYIKNVLLDTPVTTLQESEPQIETRCRVARERQGIFEHVWYSIKPALMNENRIEHLS